MSVLLLSGGLDSAVLLAREVNAGRHPVCLCFNYGQRHWGCESWCAYQIAHYYGREFFRSEIPKGLFRGSSLTGDGAIPHAHYEAPEQRTTVVPNRNMVMLSSAIAMAIQWGARNVLFAAHRGDATIYPDCRAEFVQAMDKASREAWGVAVEAPLLGMSKREIVALGRKLQVPFDMTWSCYESGRIPCGQCGACIERQEAMA